MRQANRQTGLPAPKHSVRPASRQAGKMLVPLLGILAVLSMVVAAAASVVLMQEREKRQAKERDLQIALQQNDELKNQLESVQQAKTQVEGELTRVRKDLVEKEEKLSKAVEAQQTLSKSVDDRQQEIARLTKDLEQTRNDSKQLTTQLSDLQAEREKLKTQLADVEKAKGELETKLVESTDRPTVELEKVLVTNNGKTEGTAASTTAASTADSTSQPQSPAATALPVSTTSSAATGQEGQVVVINREYDFIVMNLGKKHGLSAGQEFQVVRGNQVLGKVKVEKVYDELSAAAILPESKKDTIREGDTVKAL